MKVANRPEEELGKGILARMLLPQLWVDSGNSEPKSGYFCGCGVRMFENAKKDRIDERDVGFNSDVVCTYKYILWVLTGRGVAK